MKLLRKKAITYEEVIAKEKTYVVIYYKKPHGWGM